MTRFLFLILAALMWSMTWVTIAGASETNQGVQNVWVQVVPPHTGMLRAITSKSRCPIARLDGRAVRMHVRARPNSDFKVLTCELELPPHTRKIHVSGRSLRPVPSDPQRIAIVGDSGCRMKDGSALDDGFQNCGDPDDWEFAKVAQRVADWRPDLIIQLGDYIYREQECPDGCSNCAGSPYNSPGMRMDTWNIEFFDPGRAMLEAAPIVLIRGDHEKCERAGGGYFRFLDARGFQACTDFSDPYAIDFDDLQLVVMDTVQADDTSLSPGVVIDRYAHDFNRAARLSTGNTWLLSHRPIWAFRPAAAPYTSTDIDECRNQTIPRLIAEDINVSVQAALKHSRLAGILPPEIEMVVTSHAHVAEMLSFSGMRPPEAVVGISGTKLLPALNPRRLVGRWIDGEVVTHAMLLSEHGFFGVRPRSVGWRASVLDVSGETLSICRIRDKVARCRTP